MFRSFIYQHIKKLKFYKIPNHAKRAVAAIKYAPGIFNKALCFPSPRKINSREPKRLTPMIG